MHLLTFITAAVLSGCALGQNQSSDTPNNRLADQEVKLQAQFNTTYYIAVAHAPPIPQLYISDEEARELCQPYAKDHASISVSHPRTCSARVQCTRQRKNPYVVNTVYRIIAYVFAMAQGTFWSQQRTLISWNTNNDCAADPCKTGRNMTDGRFCFTYLTCVRDGEVLSYGERECLIGQAFNSYSRVCEDDATCVRPRPGDRVTNLYCNATKPNVIIPGTLPESYFNRTFRNNDDNITYTVPEYCPGSLVFDDRNPRDCLCVPLSELRSTTPEECPKTLVEINSMKSLNWNNAPLQDGSYTTETGSLYNGWARFEGTGTSFYSAGVLNNNELTYDFTLSFEFVLDSRNGLPSGSVALVSNSLNANTCPTATLRVYLNPSRSVVAEATNVNNVRVTVQSPPVNPASIVRVVVKREGGNLKLSVNRGQETTSGDLGSLRLKSTNCGLVMAKSSGLLSLRGWMDRLVLISNCPPGN